jgi:nitrite reductase/ring-hydroxylating ferredoxin subunit
MSIKYYSCDMAELFLWREEGECHGMIEKCHHQGTPLAQFLKFLVWVTVRLHSPMRLA